MGVNSSRAKYLPDTDAAVVFRAPGSAAVTSTALSTAVPMNELDSAWWHDGNEIPGGVFEVNITITACDITTADEAYTFNVVVDDVLALNDNPRTVASLIFPAGLIRVGSYKVFVASDQIKALDTDTTGTDKWIGISAVLAGTTPSVTYSANIGKVVSRG